MRAVVRESVVGLEVGEVHAELLVEKHAAVLRARVEKGVVLDHAAAREVDLARRGSELVSGGLALVRAAVEDHAAHLRLDVLEVHMLQLWQHPG